MTDFAHVLMTRFNLATPGREATIRNQPDWLETRFDLFERYCLPSVAAQTTSDFTWIIYFDKDTPPAFKNRIAALQREVPFTPYYTGLFPGEGWPRSVEEVLGRRAQHLLTSRLDNDDALAVDYMARTADAARGAAEKLQTVPRIGIVITNGFIRSGQALYQISHPCNAFTSWLEPGGSDLDTTRTAMGIAHMDAAQEGPLVQVPGPGGWLQVVHGGNVSNKVRGRRVAASKGQSRFPSGAVDELALIAPSRIWLENSFLAPLRGARDAAAGMRRTLLLRR